MRKHPSGSLPGHHRMSRRPCVSSSGSVTFHCRLPLGQDRQKLAGLRDDEVASGCQAPLAQVRLEHGRVITCRKGRPHRPGAWDCGGRLPAWPRLRHRPGSLRRPDLHLADPVGGFGKAPVEADEGGTSRRLHQVALACGDCSG